MNLITPDYGEKFAVELSNSTLTEIKGQQAKDPELAITINQSDLEAVMMGTKTFDEQVASGKAKLDGERQPLDKLRGMLVQFTPDFELIPGTKPATPTASAEDPFEQEPPALTDGR